MASSAVVFTAGLAVGAAGAAILTRSRQRDSPPAPSSGSTAVGRVQEVKSVGPGYAVADSLRYGHPGPISDFFQRQAYAVAYDRRLRNPAWTAEHLTAENIRRPAEALPSPSGSPGPSRPDRSRSQFLEDPQVPSMFQAKLSDYFRSGYDRGHMVPAADAKRSQEAMDETFLLTNISPQVGEGFNRDYWAYFEEFTRRLTGSFRDVYVFTVPLYLPAFDVNTRKYRVSYEVIGEPPNVAVPTHFAKVIYALPPSSTLGLSSGSLGAFVLPNALIPDSKPLEEFVVPVEAVEKASGLQLFGEGVKSSSRALCQTVKCEVVVRKFDDARKRVGAPPAGSDPLRRGRPTRAETL